MSIVFALIAALVGAALAAADDIDAWFGAGLGAALGLLAGRLLVQSRRARVLTEQLIETTRKLDVLNLHLGRVLPEVDQRLARVEAVLARGVVSPASVTPARAADSVAEVTVATSKVSVATRPPAPHAGPRFEAAIAAPTESSPVRFSPAFAPPPIEISAPSPSPSPKAAPPEYAPSEDVPPEARPMRMPFEPRGPSLLERGFLAARGWLLGGNTIVRVGVLLLFLGLAFLLRYASERVVVPIEIRYAGVAAAALALLFVGWRTRVRNAAYGLLLQGAAVGVLYLTTFAAMRLHPLLPMQAGFILLVVVAALAAFLAIQQDAPGLAIAGTLGGFAAPVLASTGGGSHVALFSYLLLLNAGVLAIAWFKSWRVLNLVGFVGTFGIGLTWGLRSYKPEQLASCEAFLLAFFLMYVLLALLFARHRLVDWAANLPELERGALLRDAASHANAIDGTLIFGVPLAAFGIQLALVHGLEFGSAFSALGLGAFYLLLARALFERGRQRFLLLVEVFLALGVVFASLTIPLGLDGQWTTATWALEGAGLFWVGTRQKRPLARAFALLLQLGAALYFLRALRDMPADSRVLLGGSWLGAGLLGLAFLSNYRVARNALAVGSHERDMVLKPVFAALGLVFAYLVAPLLGGSSLTAVAWAIAGLATVWGGLRLADPAYWVAGGTLAQLAAGALYLVSHSQGAGDSTQVFAAGFSGLLICALLGVTTLVSAVLAQRQAALLPRLAAGTRVALIFALGLINLAVLFVLPWCAAAGVWAGSGLLIVWLSLWLRQRPPLWFGLSLQLVGAAAFLSHLAPLPGAGELHAFRHAGFIVPLVMALAAYGVGFRIHRSGVEVLGARLKPLSLIALLWGSLWWAYAWGAELNRVLLAWEAALHAMLAVLSLSVMLWALAARRWRWPELGRFCFALLPVAASLLCLVLLGHHYTPWAHYGALAWFTVLAAHLLVLHLLPSEPTLRAPVATRFAHAGGVWLFLLVLALGLRRTFATLGDEASAWAWLGWALAPTGYLLVISRVRETRVWPVRDDLTAYRDLAGGPIVLALLAWVMLANLASTGSAAPLPYLPVLNPLELAFGFVLLACAVWQRQRLATTALSRAGWPSALLAGVAFVSYTCGVARTVHYWAKVPFALDQMLDSMVFQAGISLAWSLAALTIMVLGNRRARRGAWITGATLVAVVVAKLFLVELSNRGGLERIVSFIGVGVLLLVVGYFAPMPPRKTEPTS
ncbi:MAG: DUF2339 domain-containing protein [Polyangiaceae bacterium]